MPRPKKVTPKETQRFPIDDGAVVVIEFDPASRPKMVYIDGVVIIGDHVCQQRAARIEQPSVTNGPTEDTPEMIAWKARRAKPLTPADTAREAGFPALDFETAQNIAASMGGGEEPVL